MTISHDLEKGQRRLNLVVGILTVFQVAGVIYEFTKTTEFKICATASTFILGFAILCFVVSTRKKLKYGVNL